MVRLLILALGAALALLSSACSLAGEASALPTLGTAPDFALLDQQGRTFSSAELRGKTVLVSFIYTSCIDECPLLSSAMHTAQERLRQDGLLGSKVALLSITVDPRRDTVAALAAYARQFQADPDAWRFLTGPPEQVLQVVTGGFKMAAEPGDASRPGRDILHSSRVALVDPAGKIRAYFPAAPFDVEGALRAARLLAKG